MNLLINGNTSQLPIDYYLTNRIVGGSSGGEGCLLVSCKISFGLGIVSTQLKPKC